MSSVKRIFAIERLSDIQLNTIKKPINCFLFELEGESRYVTKRTYPSSSETTKLQFHWSIIITSSYHYLFIEKVKSSELLIKQPRYGGRRRTQIPWLATMLPPQTEFFFFFRSNSQCSLSLVMSLPTLGKTAPLEWTPYDIMNHTMKWRQA